QQDQLVDASRVNLFQIFGGHFVTGFDINLARAFVDQVISRIATKDFFGRDQQGGQTIFGGLIGQTGADLVTGGKDNFAGVSVNNVKGRLCTAPIFDNQLNLPTISGAFKHQTVIEVVENFFARHAQS